jgi:hypothetical protein
VLGWIALILLRISTVFICKWLLTCTQLWLTWCQHKFVHKLLKWHLACAPAGARALALIDQFKEQELSNVVWAFAKLHHYEQGLFAHLLAAVKAKLHHFLPQVGSIAENHL